MKIKYINDDTLTIGIAGYDEDKYICPGYDNLLVLAIADMATTTERAQLLNMGEFKAFAKPTENDWFNETTGKQIVRDKLIIRDSERQILKVSIIEKYLKKILNGVGDTTKHHTDRMDNAYARMEALQ